MGTLYSRQPVLTVFGMLFLVIAAVTFGLQFVDLRQLDGVDVWIKPTKFFFSVAVFALTAAWFFGYVRPERRTSAGMLYVVWVIVVFGTFENGWITWQAAHRLASHFNSSTLLYGVMYGLMGVGALLLVSTCVPLAWEIARRPVAGLRADYRFAVVAGLVLTCVLGGGAGMYMGAQHGHSVGLQGGFLPIFGWNRSGGDLRVAHFFGMHFEQALPLLAAVMTPLPKGVRWTIIGLAMVGGVVLTIGVGVQAVMGLPFLPGLV